jgi:hypothetical protein
MFFNIHWPLVATILASSKNLELFLSYKINMHTNFVTHLQFFPQCPTWNDLGLSNCVVVHTMHIDKKMVHFDFSTILSHLFWSIVKNTQPISSK